MFKYRPANHSIVISNLAKALLYAINGGKDEKSKAQVGPE
ncbi:pyruvate formate lyase family protein, partial [Bacillus sp. D-CC]